MIETDTPSVTRKKEIRQKMLALRRALSATDMEAMSLALADRICESAVYQKAHRIMAYLSMKEKPISIFSSAMLFLMGKRSTSLYVCRESRWRRDGSWIWSISPKDRMACGICPRAMKS